MKLDSLDVKILTVMARDAKKPYTDIGRELKVHPNVVGYRVNRMEKAGVIKGYLLDVDLEKIGFNEQLFVGANFPRDGSRDKIIKQVVSMPQALTVLSTLGNPELLIFLLGRNKSDIEETLSKLKGLNLDVKYSSPIVKAQRNGDLNILLKTLESDGETPGEKMGEVTALIE